MASEDGARPGVVVSYLGVVLIWSTTPLGIKWSTEVGFVQGLALRMLSATVLLVLLQAALRRPLPMDRDAVLTYLAGTLGVFFAMTCVYWAAQSLPSGLLAVVFGMAPMITALFSALLLGERDDLPRKLLGGAIGLGGLALIYTDDLALGGARLALLAVLASTAFYSLGAVLMKRIASAADHVSITTGSMLAAAPLFLIAWGMLGLELPSDPPPRALAAIAYLALAGSVLGFLMYFYLLKHIRASSAVLITLITPVSALVLGALLNDEQLPASVLAGSAVILLGLAVFVDPLSALRSAGRAPR